jgi:hypothetical protein
VSVLGIRRFRRFSQRKNKAFIFHAWGVEVDKQCFFEAGGPQVVDDLGFLGAGQFLESLDLYKD